MSHLFSPKGLDFSDRTQIYQSLETGDESDTVVHAWNISMWAVAVGRTFQGQPGLRETPSPHLPSPHKQDESTASLGPVGRQWALTDWQTSWQRKWSHCLSSTSSFSLFLAQIYFLSLQCPSPRKQTQSAFPASLSTLSSPEWPLQSANLSTAQPGCISPKSFMPSSIPANNSSVINVSNDNTQTSCSGHRDSSSRMWTPRRHYFAKSQTWLWFFGFNH